MNVMLSLCAFVIVDAVAVALFACLIVGLVVSIKAVLEGLW